jgi:hypothetical protein
VAVDGQALSRIVMVNGTCRVGSLSKGCYTISWSTGTTTIELDHDMTVKIDKRGAVMGWTWDWLPYAVIALVAAAGLAIALRLLKRR